MLDLFRKSKIMSALSAAASFFLRQDQKSQIPDVPKVEALLGRKLSRYNGHFTKRGPGRIHAFSNRPWRRRLAPAQVGGNWQGKEYVTYAEHDYICQSYLYMPSVPRDDPFHHKTMLGRRALLTRCAQALVNDRAGAL